MTALPATAPQPSSPSLLLDEETFCRWFGDAEPGHGIEYHRGHLVIDRAHGFSLLDEKPRRELHAIAKRAVFLAEASRLILVQRRLDEGEFSYLAIKTKQPAWRTA
jgi:hypothetical protein